MSQIIKENKRFKRRFEQYEKKEASKVSTTSYGGNSYYNSRWKDVPKEFQITLFFYEWSSMNKGAKTFYDRREFMKFLEESKITYTEEQKKKLDYDTYLYVTCYPNKSELMIADTYWKLDTALKEAKGIKVESRVSHYPEEDSGMGAWRDHYGNCYWD